MSDGQSKYWCFTLNNYSATHEATFVEWASNFCSYATYGREIGSEETPHLQGYFELKKRKRFSSLKRSFCQVDLAAIHLEMRRGTAQQAADYCQKDGDFFEVGSLSRSQGSRSDLIQLREDLLAQKSLQDIAQEHFGSFLRYQRGINAFRSIVAPQRMWPVQVHVWWGKTGTGKTRRVYETVGDGALYSHPGGPWFDGYDSQPNVLFDEFSGSYFSLTYLLKLLDRYPMQVPIKGSFVSFVPKSIFITSNYPPEEWYPSAKEEHRAALMRRLTEIDEMFE